MSTASLQDLITADQLDGLSDDDAAAWRVRLDLVAPDLLRALRLLYGPQAPVQTLLRTVAAASTTRPAALRRLDRRREIDRGWFQHESMVGYCAYVDRFAGSVRGLQTPQVLDHLGRLGVTYLHLMPLLRARPGENDGGYAVSDYREVDPRLGSMADLTALAGVLHERGIALCVDLVVNHTSDDHAWARAARAGDESKQRYYRIYPDRTEPDQWERYAREVFPANAPGNFTFVPDLGWVWTTFNPYQWDLDWSQPEVFREILEVILFLANQGVDVLRMDAVPFLWKRMGTDCQNQPEAHLILQALRSLVQVGAPGVLLLAEAIVAPDDLVPYLGAHDRFRPECDLAYHNQLMVLLWSSFAARDVALMRQALGRMQQAPDSTAWLTFLRSHDDIGWAIHDADAASLGLHGWSHRRFLAEFYAGRHPGSFARGQLFQDDPATGDARVVGGTRALTGIAAAETSGDEAQLEQGIRRLLALWSVTAGYDGFPLLWMGDEIAHPDDADWALTPEQVGDGRWLHRPHMDWGLVDKAAADPTTVEGRVLVGLQRMMRARAGLVALRAGGTVEPWDSGDQRVFLYRRRHPRSGWFVGLANVSEQRVLVHVSLLDLAGLGQRAVVACGSDAITGSPAPIHDGWLVLEPLGWVWLVTPEELQAARLPV